MGDITICVVAALLVLLSGLFMRRLVRTTLKGRATKLILGNLLALVFLLSTLFFCGEMYYRFIFDKPDPYGVTRATWRWFARHFQYNRMGLRDNMEYSPTMLPGKRRISFLGDSFTAGHGVGRPEDRMVNLVRARRPDWDVHCLAKVGVDTPHEIKMIEWVTTLGYQFDTVVLMYCLNDVAALSPGYEDACRRIYLKQQNEGFLLKHSYLVNTLYYRVAIRSQPDIADYYGFVRDAYKPENWSAEEDQLKLLHDLVASRNGRLMVVIYPFFHLVGRDYPYTEAHRKVAGFCASNSIPCLDLYDVYSGRKPGDLVVSRYDSHPNEKANAIAVEPIIKFVGTHLK